MRRFLQIIHTAWLARIVAGLLAACVSALSLAQSLPLVVETPADPPQSFRVLCYHDIRDNLRASFQTAPDSTAIGTRELIAQFNWLNENGYKPVSLQQIVDARAGKGSLPDKAVLLTFDDGYKSVYTKVFPLLQQFHFPAVIALVGDWIETPTGSKVHYGDELVAREQFATWDDVREMVASGLVEVASHSHDLHKGIVANPQGNLIPAAVAHAWSQEHRAYETEAQYAKRIRADLKRNADLIARKLGKRPRAMVWPYGMYNMHMAQWSAEAGMPITMNLEAGANTPAQPLSRMRRALMTYDQGLADLIGVLRQPASYDGVERPLERVVHVDLDYVYDPDPAVQEANLSKLLDRMQRLHPSTVYLQAYADADGDGVADALYFPNRHLPMRADLFSRVAWQLQTRVGVKVYAWMPVLAFKLPATDPAAGRTVRLMQDAPAAAAKGRYHRLSPFDSLARKTVTEIYEDLGRSAIFNGILFHDDVTLSDYEDASPAALAVYRDQWHLPAAVEAIRQDPVARRTWAQKKTAYLTAFTMSLADTLRQYQPTLLTARNLYAQPVLDPASEDWYAQTLPDFLAHYDFTAVMAMPYMEGATDPTQWLNQLIAKVKAVPGALGKTVFELQSRDWRNGQAIPAATLVSQLRQLHAQGARHLGYYPDDFHANAPDESIIAPAISAATVPAWR
ncbi:MAG: poly-beta-1,6-N-acetyl-D-glucosamine N-deacetylase PgaB [Proteobacteria bacterium]|nr:poly-beta-1,6-N-acetyl-D-glucosamine N-deacetylase PgaB [Pseudomonadota bacterium]